MQMLLAISNKMSAPFEKREVACVAWTNVSFGFDYASPTYLFIYIAKNFECKYFDFRKKGNEFDIYSKRLQQMFAAHKVSLLFTCGCSLILYSNGRPIKVIYIRRGVIETTKAQLSTFTRKRTQFVPSNLEKWYLNFMKRKNTRNTKW